MNSSSARIGEIANFSVARVDRDGQLISVERWRGHGIEHLARRIAAAFGGIVEIKVMADGVVWALVTKADGEKISVTKVRKAP